MKVILLAGAIVASTAFGAFAAGPQLSQAECDTLWNQANPSGAASITQAQAQPYITDFKAANPDRDSSLDQKEFSAACKNGLVKGMGSSGAASGDPSDKMAPAEKMAPKDSSGSKY
jgi:hypothetical protein